MALVDVLLELAMLLAGFAAVNFLLSLIFKRNDLADVAWGLGFVLVCGYLWWQLPANPTALAVYGMVTLWGLRLSGYIGMRNSKKGEDFRYKKWREEWGRWVYVRSFLQVFLLQMGILLVIALPIAVAGVFGPSASLNVLQYALMVGWTLGFLWQAVADYQLSQFKKARTGGVMKTGLWKYSRHPNYFGEIVMWWSIGLFVLVATLHWYLILSPILITYLLLNVSGVPMLEAKYRNDSDYQDYVKKTPAVFPFGRKRA